MIKSELTEPAVLIALDDGRLIAQNGRAQQLIGDGIGRACWTVVGGLAPGCTPCQHGCVRRLLESGIESSRYAEFIIDGRRCSLTCVPVAGVVVSTLNVRDVTDPCAGDVLSPRQTDVLQLLAEGNTTRVIAEKLGLSDSTIRTHVENMLFKLGASSRAALVATAFRLGCLG